MTAIQKLEPKDVPPEMVRAVEAEVGMGRNAWDCVDPREIVAAVINTLFQGLWKSKGNG